MYRYTGVDQGDQAALWRIQNVLYPGGAMDVATGVGGNATVKRLSIEEKF